MGLLTESCTFQTNFLYILCFNLNLRPTNMDRASYHCITKGTEYQKLKPGNKPLLFVIWTRSVRTSEIIQSTSVCIVANWFVGLKLVELKSSYLNCIKLFNRFGVVFRPLKTRIGSGRLCGSVIGCGRGTRNSWLRKQLASDRTPGSQLFWQHRQTTAESRQVTRIISTTATAVAFAWHHKQYLPRHRHSDFWQGSSGKITL